MLLILLLITILVPKDSYGAISAQEGRAIAQCLERYGGVTIENAERLERYQDWTDNYEEFPCFTKCYLNKLGTMYTDAAGFKEHAIRREFGDAVYTACENHLEQSVGSCDTVYKFFHCLVTLQDDPFMLIENMQNVTKEAKSSMQSCLRNFKQENWVKIAEYKKTPANEPIPCFAKCFVDDLELLNTRNRRWNIQNMQAKLNIPSRPDKTSHCDTPNKRRKIKACIWVYTEFMCFVKASYNRLF